MKKKMIIILVMLMMIMGIIVLSSQNILNKNNNFTLKIVTSFYPMYIATLNIVHDVEGVELINLTEPETGCLHDYQLTPGDMASLETADILVINGGGAEGFVDSVVSQYPKLHIIDTSKGITMIENEIEDEHGHGHGESNTHIWMSVANYMLQIQNIVSALSEKDYANQELYKKNAKDYLGELAKLKADIDNAVNTQVQENIVIFHDAFAYLAKEWNLNIKHIVNVDSDTALAAGELKEVIDLIGEYNIRIILAEKQYGKKAASTVENETSGKVYVLDSLVTGELKRDSYIKDMRDNIEVMKGILN